MVQSEVKVITNKHKHAHQIIDFSVNFSGDMKHVGILGNMSSSSPRNRRPLLDACAEVISYTHHFRHYPPYLFFNFLNSVGPFVYLPIILYILYCVGLTRDVYCNQSSMLAAILLKSLIDWLIEIESTIKHKHYHTLQITHPVSQLCGLTGQSTHQEGLGLGGLVYEETHLCFLYFIQIPFKCVNAGSIDHPLVQLISSNNYSR